MTPAVDAAKARRHRNKTEFDWGAAAERYRMKLIDLYGTLRVLGATEDIPLDNLFTDVFIFNELTARRRFIFQDLQKLGHEDFLRSEGERRRVNGVTLVNQGKNLYILGKPGAGKTTFLKYITIQAARHRVVNRLPIFVQLHDWVQTWIRHSDIDLLAFISQRFDICGFPNAEEFVENLFNTGRALVLFDGLDEVKQEEGQRAFLSGLLQDFVNKYGRVQTLITCRIAADEYAFHGFRTVEVADFNEKQVESYAKKWFISKPEKLDLFLAELRKPQHRGVRELCNTPLLLSMICLAFDDNLYLGESRIEIYENALDALLRRWDASRNRQRDAIFYGKLRPPLKLQILATVAAKTFERNEYFMRQRDLEAELIELLSHLPTSPHKTEIDGLCVLKAIEAQHSLLIEQATAIYSFSHLTIQEYLTAYYIKENHRTSILLEHLHDNRWRETFFAYCRTSSKC